MDADENGHRSMKVQYIIRSCNTNESNEEQTLNVYMLTIKIKKVAFAETISIVSCVSLKFPSNKKTELFAEFF